MFEAIDLNPAKDFYVGNMVKCRPIAPAGSTRKNITPKSIQLQQCRPFLDQEIKFIDPKLVVLLGKTAAAGLLPDLSGEPMWKLSGRHILKGDINYFILYHPASILHASGQKEVELKDRVWQDLQSLRDLAKEV